MVSDTIRTPFELPDELDTDAGFVPLGVQGEAADRTPRRPPGRPQHGGGLVHDLNAPLTSSMGRLFDGVSALLGVRQTVNYEAQAAIELEMLVDGEDTAVYPFDIVNGCIDPAPMFRQIVNEMRAGTETAVIATRFHNSISWLVVHICQRIRQETGLNEVVLSGGVWQNMTLLQRTIPHLEMNDFNVYWHKTLPANDGGLALGQAMIAATHSSLILHNS